MADVEDVEASVGEGDLVAGGSPGGDALLEFVTSQNLWMEWFGQ